MIKNYCSVMYIVALLRRIVVFVRRNVSPVAVCEIHGVFCITATINQSEIKWATCNAPFRQSSRISRSHGKALVNSARTQKLVGGSAPKSTIVIISDHMSDTVRNHLARAF